MTNFDNIKKGDRVKIETHEGDFAEFTVQTKEYSFINSKTNSYDHQIIKSLEVVKPPVPTEPGFYKVEDGDNRVFMLDNYKNWHIIYTEDLSVSKQPDDFIENQFHNFTRIEL